MRKIIKKRTNINSNIYNLLEEGFNIRILLIQELIPVGLMPVNDILQVWSTPVGKLYRYSRGKDKRDIVHWGFSAELQYIYSTWEGKGLCFPRVRNKATGKEVVLSNYRKLQEPLDGYKIFPYHSLFSPVIVASPSLVISSPAEKSQSSCLPQGHKTLFPSTPCNRGACFLSTFRKTPPLLQSMEKHL